MLALAVRNVLRHTSHSLLLAALFALAAFLFISGNSLLSHSNRMLREVFVKNITSDLVLAAESEESLSIFGANTPAIGELIPIPILKHKDELAEAAEALPEVQGVSPLVSGAAVMDLAGRRSTVPVFGIEPESYFSLLEGLEVSAGRALRPGERGVMLSASHIARIERQSGNTVELGDEVMLTTGQDRRFRIRAAPLVGVFRYPVSMDYVDEIVLADAATVRALNSIQTRVIDDTTEVEGPRSAADVDSLFGGEADSEEAGGSEADTSTDNAEAGGGITPEEVLERVGEGGGEEGAAAADGAGGTVAAGGSAHFLLLRGSDSSELRDIAAGYGAQVLSWRQAAGQAALLALLLQIIFNGGFVLFVIAVTLGATNIVLISTYRRTREIGTLRAIGIDDRELRTMFILEHLIIGVAGWLAGLAGSVILSAVVASQELSVDNQLIAMLLGGRVVRLPIDPASVALCLLVVLLVVGLAVLVPLSGVIRKPIVDAVRSE